METENDYTVPIPCWYFVNRNDWPQQLQKVHSEIGEIVEAMLDGDKDHAAEEMVDAITALTTMLEIIGYDKDRRAIMQAKVNEKNRRRGYWNKERCKENVN